MNSSLHMRQKMNFRRSHSKLFYALLISNIPNGKSHTMYMHSNISNIICVMVVFIRTFLIPYNILCHQSCGHGNLLVGLQYV